MRSSEVQDLVVIGGGTSGIAAARFYLDIHPKRKVTVIERDGAVGGVWSKERVYDGFKSQGSTRLGGFSDVPFSPPKEGVDDNDFFDAKHMAEYLDEYVDKHSYDGQALRERFKLNTTVTSLEKLAGVWKIHCRQTDSNETSLTAQKLIVASGSTSVPNMPNLKGADIFQGPIIHTLHFGQSKVLETLKIKKVTVLGGGKSAADMVYQSVKAGKEVSWIIRKSGKGPGGFLYGAAPGPYRNGTELALTRWFSKILLPSGLGPDSWWQAFLFRTSLGRWLYTKFQDGASKQLNGAARYDDRPGARGSFKNLKNEMSPFWLTSPAGMIHYDDFWDTIAKNVDVYREDIMSLEAHKINFESGESIPSDAVLCGTGFGEIIPFLSTEQSIEFGLPHSTSDDSSSEAAEWVKLEEAAKPNILQRFPYLAHPPPLPENFGDISSTITPYRLYNCIAPLSDLEEHSIAFIGFAIVTNMFAGSEVSSMWATAYLDGKLQSQLPGLEDMRKDVAHKNAYQRLRCPTYGRLGNFYAFDYFPFMDRLLGQELGLKSWKKGWWGDLTTPMLMKDLKGCGEEYRAKYGGDEE